MSSRSISYKGSYMTKYDIYGDGTIIEVSNPVFLRLLAQLTEICYRLAESYIGNHASGLADFDNEYFKDNSDRVRKQFTIASEGLKDELLSKELSDLIRLVNDLSDTDAAIIKAYLAEFGISGSEMRLKFSLKNRVAYHLYEKHRPPPGIVFQIAQESAKVVPVLKNLRQLILDRIEYLLTLEKECADDIPSG